MFEPRSQAPAARAARSCTLPRFKWTWVIHVEWTLTSMIQLESPAHSCSFLYLLWMCCVLWTSLSHESPTLTWFTASRSPHCASSSPLSSNTFQRFVFNGFPIAFNGFQWIPIDSNEFKLWIHSAKHSDCISSNWTLGGSFSLRQELRITLELFLFLSFSVHFHSLS